MYATVSHDVIAGPHPIEDVRTALLKVFKDYETCDLLSDTFICSVDDADDYLDLAEALKEVGKKFSGQMLFVITLHSPDDPLRSNGKYPKLDAKKILKGDGN